jgi:hypothetical protein
MSICLEECKVQMIRMQLKSDIGPSLRHLNAQALPKFRNLGLLKPEVQVQVTSVIPKGAGLSSVLLRGRRWVSRGSCHLSTAHTQAAQHPAVELCDLACVGPPPASDEPVELELTIGV